MDVWEWVSVYRRGSVGRGQYEHLGVGGYSNSRTGPPDELVLAVAVFNRGV